MAIKARDIPRILIERLEATHPAPAFFDADDTDHWPPGVLQQLLDSKIIQPAPRAVSTTCGGCDWNCNKRVVFRQKPAKGGPHAFVQCNEAPDLGRIHVSIDRLETYRLLAGSLDAAVKAALATKSNALQLVAAPKIRMVKGRFGHRQISIQLIGGKLIAVVGRQRDPLVNIMGWESGLNIDRARLIRMANRKEFAMKSRQSYQPDRSKQRAGSRRTSVRDQRIQREAKELMTVGKNQTEAAIEIAQMDFIKKPAGQTKAITAARVRRILSEKIAKS